MARFKIAALLAIFFVGSFFSSVIVKAEFYFWEKEKILLEVKLEERLKDALSKILESEDLVVMVNIEPFTELKEEPDEEGLSEEVHTRGDIFVLPGVPAVKKLGEINLPPPEKEKLPPLSQRFIKKIVVEVVVKKKLSDELKVQVRDICITILGMNSTRGDRLFIKSVPAPFFKWEKFIKPPNIYWTFIILMLSLFLFGPMWTFFRSLTGALALGRKEEVSIFSKESTNPSTIQIGGEGILGSAEKEGKEKTEKRPFNFVNEENFKNLIYLLKNETVENTAVVINYLEPNLSLRVFSSLPQERQNDVIVYMSKINQFSPEDVIEVEKEFKSKIGSMVGGEEFLSETIQIASKEIQQNILSALRDANSELAEKLRKAIFTFEDINHLDSSSLHRILREVDIHTFARALKGASEELRNKIFKELSEGASTMLKQEIDLTPDISQKRIEEEQQKIVSVIHHLERAGMLEIGTEES